jgi:hypothetical protein
MSAGMRLSLLGAWAGALLVWSLLVVPAAFSVLPGTDLAAEMVGATLDPLDRAGIALALATAALGWVGSRPGSGAQRIRALLPLLAGAAHALSLLVVSPEIRALREVAGGSIGRLAAGDPTVVRFGWMHSMSGLLFIGAGLTVLATVAWDLLRGSTPPANSAR